MKSLVTIQKVKGLMLLCFLTLVCPQIVFAKDFVVHDSILEERTAQKIEEMGSELFAKSGVQVFLIAKQNSDEEIVAFEKNFAKDLNGSYVLLTLFQEQKKVDIYASSDMEKAFDKEAILSPLPWKGTIIPLLTTKKKDVSAGAALLNGYADIVEQIAAFKKVDLQSAIGSSNKTTINLVRLGVYGFVGFLVVLMLYRRIKNRG